MPHPTRTKITTDLYESHLKCRRKSSLHIAGERGSPSEYGVLLHEARARVRADAVADLLRESECEVPRDVSLTTSILKSGAPLLLDVLFEDDDLSIRIDGLKKAAGPSRLGDFHYLPILFHEAERPNREH